jgi:hypothetical protein
LDDGVLVRGWDDDALADADGLGVELCCADVLVALTVGVGGEWKPLLDEVEQADVTTDRVAHIASVLRRRRTKAETRRRETARVTGQPAS